MSIRLTQEMNWVSDDGSYGYGEIITFQDKDLTPRQLEVYEDLDEDDRFAYVQAIMNGDPTDEWETNE